MLKRKIGWQKYEDVIEGQINSPIADMISKSILSNRQLESHFHSENTHQGYEEEEELEEPSHQFVVSFPDDISNEINLMSNFDCWVGHANFNLTDDIKKQLSLQDGVEVLKVCSRYRFFIGIGRMFDFSEVRKEIEESFL